MYVVRLSNVRAQSTLHARPHTYEAYDVDRRQGYPNIRTVDYWLGGNKAERFPQSRYVHRLLFTYKSEQVETRKCN